jgi:hypothetical protein
VIEAYQAHAERLADLLLEQLERLGVTEHEEAYVLTLVAERLVGRTAELGEVIEFEAHELSDQVALQMATALQGHCASLHKILDQIAADPRFGLLPGSTPGHNAPRPPRPPTNGHTPE